MQMREKKTTKYPEKKTERKKKQKIKKLNKNKKVNKRREK